MATKNVNITINTDQLSEAMKKIADAAASVTIPMRRAGKTLAAAQMAAIQSASASGEALMPDGALISTRQYRELAEKFSRCAQRMTLLLSLLSVEELKRLGLLAPDAASNGSLDKWDQAVILQALDARVDQFNEAHKRLTGTKKKTLDNGRVELSQEEFATVMAARASGMSTSEILKTIEKSRSKKVP